MASLFDELNSSGSEDEDYIPDEKVSSDEEPIPASSSDDEKETRKNRKRKAPDSKDKACKTDEKKEEKSKVDEKQRANDIYKSFLEEVELEMNAKKESESDTYFDTNSGALSSPCSSKSSATSQFKQIDEHFSFAGETVVVSKNATDGNIVSESTGSVATESTTAGAPVPNSVVSKRKGGLESVLNTIKNKKQRLTTLQKSSIDWTAFKKEEDIKEDLERFNKGRHGYIERQRFLERSDVRSYEIEREARLSRVKK